MTTWATYGTTDATTSRSSFTAGNGSKSAWQVITSSSSAAADLLLLSLGVITSGEEHLFDIGVGGSGSEVVVVPDICVDVNSAFLVSYPIEVPTIASGSRIVIRAEAPTGANTVGWSLITASAKAPAPPTSPIYETYGITLGSSSKNVQLDPGTTANTESGWFEITPTTATNAGVDSFYMYFGRDNDASKSNGRFFVDLGIGAPSSQTVVFSNFFVGTDGGPDSAWPGWFGPLPGDDIAGQRVWMRIQSNITTNQTIGAAIVTVR